MDSALFMSIAQAATETVHVTEESAGGIGALGLDVRALLFQVFNFAILLALLRAFAYRPIVRVLEARRQKIAESLENAKQIEATRASLAEQERAVLNAARAKAQTIVESGHQRAEQLITAAEVKAKEQAAHTVEIAQSQIQQAVADARGKLRRDTLELVATATEKIIDTKLDPKKDAALIEKAVSAATN